MIAFCIRFSGLPWLIRNWFCSNRVAIIVFHNPSFQSLKSHLAYLSRHYRLIKLQTFVDAVETKKTSTLPAKSMILTIDDGHAGNYGLLHLFEQYQIQPTIYLCSHMIDAGRQFPSKKIEGSKKSGQNIGHPNFSLGLKNGFGFTPYREYQGRQTLNRGEIKKMAPLCDFQSHGRFHFSLPACDDDTAIEEIAGSKKMIEKMLGKNCEHFAYPFGDYSNREVDYVKICGYKSARTTDPGWNYATSNVYRLKIVAMIPDNASRNMLCAQLTGLPRVMEYLMHHIVKGFKSIFSDNKHAF